jgi:hypothetical protein
MASAWLTLGVRPPAKGAPLSERLRFVRDFQLRALAIYLPAFIVLLIVPVSIWFVTAAAVALTLLAIDAAWLTFRIRRLERR